jgi:hypothetical protein
MNLVMSESDKLRDRATRLFAIVLNARSKDWDSPTTLSIWRMKPSPKRTKWIGAVPEAPQLAASFVSIATSLLAHLCRDVRVTARQLLGANRTSTFTARSRSPQT